MALTIALNIVYSACHILHFHMSNDQFNLDVLCVYCFFGQVLKWTEGESFVGFFYPFSLDKTKANVFGFLLRDSSLSLSFSSLVE